MIMRARQFLYNAEKSIIINKFQASKSYPTPVGAPFANCAAPVHIFIHRFVHRF